MEDSGWKELDLEARTVCVQLDASTEHGELTGERLFFIYNAHFASQKVNLPPLDGGALWRRAIDTSLVAGADFAEDGKEIVLDPATTTLRMRGVRWCSSGKFETRNEFK